MKIQFSHKYLKLTAVGNKVRLLQAIKMPYSELSEDFIEYDTKYFHNGKFEYFEIPKSEFVIMLIFKNYSNKIFTTVRSFNKTKWNYYKKSEGKLFDVGIGGKNGINNHEKEEPSKTIQALHHSK